MKGIGDIVVDTGKGIINPCVEIGCKFLGYGFEVGFVSLDIESALLDGASVAKHADDSW